MQFLDENPGLSGAVTSYNDMLYWRNARDTGVESTWQYFLFLIPAARAARLPSEVVASSLAEKEAGHLLHVTVLDAEGSVVRQFMEKSGELYGHFGHTEVQVTQKLWRFLEPGQMVVMHGGATVCEYGLCHVTLGAAARITGADILYYAPTSAGSYSLRTYLGGMGFVLRRDDALLEYLLSQ